MIGVDERSVQPVVQAVVATQDPVTVEVRLASPVVSTAEPDPPRYPPLAPPTAEPLAFPLLKPEEEGEDDVAQADAISADAAAAPTAASVRTILTMKEFLASLR
jgi:hypothetical protein